MFVDFAFFREIQKHLHESRFFSWTTVEKHTNDNHWRKQHLSGCPGCHCTYLQKLFETVGVATVPPAALFFFQNISFWQLACKCAGILFRSCVPAPKQYRRQNSFVKEHLLEDPVWLRSSVEQTEENKTQVEQHLKRQERHWSQQQRQSQHHVPAAAPSSMTSAVHASPTRSSERSCIRSISAVAVSPFLICHLTLAEYVCHLAVVKAPRKCSRTATGSDYSDKGAVGGIANKNIYLQVFAHALERDRVFLIDFYNQVSQE